MALTSVPGQVSAGYIDGYLRNDAGDGTLGLPDLSLVPYTYAPLLEPMDGDLRWVVDSVQPGSFGAFKGTPDGLGALRSTGGVNGAFMVQVVPQNTGVKLQPPLNTSSPRIPDYTWGPRDFALAIRHPGTANWDITSVRAYLAFIQDSNSVGMRMTTSRSLGPWDAEPADSAALSLSVSGRPNLWDGAPHTISVAAFGQNVLCTIDYKCALVFRDPRAYRHVGGVVDTTTPYSTFPFIGSYGGYDARGQESYLYGWSALQGASGDLFYFDLGPLVTQASSSSTYTPTTLPSGETWTITGTATASKDGLLLAASSTASFNVAAPHGLTCTRWGTAQSSAGLMVRRQDASNYYFVSSTGVYRYTAGASTTIATFATPLANGDEVSVRNLPSQLTVYVNGVQRSNTSSLTQGQTATGIGFLNPAGGTSQWRYIAHQPIFNPPVLPTS